MNRVAALRRPRILLPRRDHVAVAHEAARLAPRRLAEMRGDDVAHLEQVADRDVFGGDLPPDVEVVGRVAHQVQMRVARDTSRASAD